LKTSLLILLLVCPGALAQGVTNWVAVPDVTPGLGLAGSNTVWEYAETPGTYFWNGFRVAMMIGLVSVTIGAITRYVGRE